MLDSQVPASECTPNEAASGDCCGSHQGKGEGTHKPSCTSGVAEAKPPRRWWSTLLGRWILRFCSRSETRTGHECNEERCALRIYCKCAKEHSEYGAAVEQRVWLLLAACGAAVILFWIFRSQGPLH